MGMKEKPEKIRQILAQNIKIRRKRLGISQEKLAEITDMSVQTINTIEGCRMWVSDKTITRLAKALNVEVFQLLIPFNAIKNESGLSPATLLQELRQKFIADTEKINSYIDHSFNEAIRRYVQRRNEEELEVQKPVREGPRRGR
jgi:transcriptional regulator with XRE-family HTH domain